MILRATYGLSILAVFPENGTKGQFVEEDDCHPLGCHVVLKVLVMYPKYNIPNTPLLNIMAPSSMAFLSIIFNNKVIFFPPKPVKDLLI